MFLIVNTFSYKAISRMTESLNIGQLKITEFEKEEFRFGNHFANVCKKVENFWKEEKYCDVTLIAGSDEKSIQAHRLVLAASNNYFDAMFSGLLRNSKFD